MKFKESIIAYQETGNSGVIDRIMSDADTINFVNNPTREYLYPERKDVSITLSAPHLYVAYRIKAIREKAVKNAWYIRQPVRYSYPQLNRYISIMILDYGYEFPFKPIKCEPYIYIFDINTELITWLRENESQIEQLFTDNFAESEFVKYRQILGLIVGVEESAVIEEERIRAEVMEDMEEALRYVMKYVDADRSDREVVKYVNASLMTRYYNAQSKRNGLRRVRRSGFDYKVKPEFASAMTTVIGGEVPDRVITKYLSEQQAEFTRKLIDAVESDKREGSTDGYSVVNDGSYRMTGAYAAQISGLTHEAARRRLSRIRNKLQIYFN